MHWSHIPQSQGRSGSTGSGDCRIDYKEGSRGSRFCQARFVNSTFIVVKKGGKWRLVLNLQSLRVHLKLEDQKPQRHPTSGYFMAKLDLKEAFFSVSIAYQSSSFLQFHWKQKLLQFTCLPFGLSSAWFVFSRLLRPVLASVRELGVRCLMYVDR